MQPTATVQRQTGEEPVARRMHGALCRIVGKDGSDGHRNQRPMPASAGSAFEDDRHTHQRRAARELEGLRRVGEKYAVFLGAGASSRMVRARTAASTMVRREELPQEVRVAC